MSAYPDVTARLSGPSGTRKNQDDGADVRHVFAASLMVGPSGHSNNAERASHQKCGEDAASDGRG